jgi:cytochrome P450
VMHPAGLSDEEIVQDLISVISAGEQPTSNWVCNALRLLLTDERFAVNVSGGRLSVGEALNEVLWLDTPTQNFIGRWAVRDVQLGGRQIRAGDCLVLGLAAANTDPQIWPEGHVGAENAAHLSFSNGEHRCPYPAPLLADVMARTAVETLLERLPDLVLSVEPEELVWRPSIWMRGLMELPVQFTPVVQ